MRYCGQCGGALDGAALTRGACPTCHALISREGDVIVPQTVTDVHAALVDDQRPTVGDNAADAPPSAKGASQLWPVPPRSAVRAPRRALSPRTVVAIVAIVFILALGLGYALHGRLHLPAFLHNWLRGTPTPHPTPTLQPTPSAFMPSLLTLHSAIFPLDR